MTKQQLLKEARDWLDSWNTGYKYQEITQYETYLLILALYDRVKKGK